jgi:hypothetical protein
MFFLNVKNCKKTNNFEVSGCHIAEAGGIMLIDVKEV